MMKKWYSIKNSDGAGNKPAQLEIFDEIGPWGVTAKDFNAALKAVSADTIELSINSIGGDVFAGLGIYNALKQSGKTINVKVMGLAASMASVIAMAGDKISMPENSFMMVHNPWTFAMGNADDLRQQADVLDKIGNNITGIYVSRTKRTEEAVKDLLKSETYMTAKEAVEHGFADEVSGEVTASAKFDISDLPEKVRLVFASVKPKVEETDPPKVDEPPPEDPSKVEDPPVQKPEEPFTAAVEASAKAAGLEVFASIFALDTKVTPENLATVISEAKEIVALCAIAQVPDKAEGFIKARASKTDVRAQLNEARVAADEAANVDTTPKASKQVDQRTELSTKAIWAKRLSSK